MLRIVCVSLATCALSGAVWAEVTPRGSEFPVNTYTTGDQGSASIASDAAGNFVVVWQSWGQDGSDTGIFGRRFDSSGVPRGPEFLVNTYTTDYQTSPSVACDAAGNFVVVWQSFYQDGSLSGIFGQAFDRTGTPAGPEFQVNTYTIGYQELPAVAGDASGDFVAAWNSLEQDGSGWGGFGRCFDPTGAPVSPELPANVFTTSHQASLSVALDAAGRFVVTWASLGQDGPDWGIFGRRFDSAGIPIGSEFQVNSYTTSYQESPSVAMDDAGNFVVAWQSWEQDGSYWGVFGRRFDSTGAPVGQDFRVNVFTPHHQLNPSVASDPAGDFVVTWTAYGQDGSSYGIFGRRFDSTGHPRGDEFQVNTHTTSDQTRSSVASDAAGDFVVSWESLDQDGSLWGVFAQRFYGRAPELTQPLDGGTVECGNPRVIRPTLAWDDDGYDRFRVYIGWGPGFGKGHQVTSGDTLLRAASWTPPAKKWRKACANALAVNPGNPSMYVKVLGVDRSLPKRSPARKRESAIIQVKVQP